MPRRGGLQAVAGRLKPGGGGSGTPVLTLDGTAPAGGSSMTVDMRAPTYALDQQWSLGSAITTYNGDGGSGILNNSTWKAKLEALGPLCWRIPLAWNGGRPGSSAGGARSYGDATLWIRGIRDMAGTPIVVCGGATSDNDIAESDLASLVNYFNNPANSGNGGRIERWFIGNEPTRFGGISARDAYTAALPGRISAMKTVDPTIKIGAPAAASWNDSEHIDIVSDIAGLDGIGYHAYDGQDTTEGVGYPLTAQYGTHIDDMRAWKPSATWLGMEEFNFDHSYTSQRAEITDYRSLVWNTSVIGHVLTHGGIALHYGDCTGAVGLMADGTSNGIQPGPRLTPYPAYWALGMWTGMNGLFRRFGGSMVTCTSSVTNVDIFGSTNGKIVIANKTASSQPVTIGVGGKASGTYNLWQMGNAQILTGPTKVASATAFSGNQISLTLPAGTASSLELAG